MLVKLAEKASVYDAINYFIPSDVYSSDISVIFISYAISLFVLTLITEAFLIWRLPIDQTPWDNKNG